MTLLEALNFAIARLKAIRQDDPQWEAAQDSLDGLLGAHAALTRLIYAHEHPFAVDAPPPFENFCSTLEPRQVLRRFVACEPCNRGDDALTVRAEWLVTTANSRLPIPVCEQHKTTWGPEGQDAAAVGWLVGPVQP